MKSFVQLWHCQVGGQEQPQLFTLSFAGIELVTLFPPIDRDARIVRDFFGILFHFFLATSVDEIVNNCENITAYSGAHLRLLL